MSLRKTALLSIASGLVFISLGGITSSTSFASSVTPTALRGTWYYSDVTGTYKLIITSKSISNQLGAAVLRNGKRISWIPNNSGQYFMRHTYLVNNVKKAKKQKKQWIFQCKNTKNDTGIFRLGHNGKFSATFKLKKAKGVPWLTSSMFDSQGHAYYSKTLQ